VTDAAVVTTEQATTRLSPSTASRRTMALAGALAVASTVGMSRLDLAPAARQPICLHWWLIALLAIAAEFMVFHVEFRRELYTFTFSEIALVLGLFLAAPRDLLIGRLIGEALFLALKERQPPRKMALNLAAFFGEVVTLLAVHQLLGRPLDIVRPGSWLVALVAMAVADLVGYLVVFQAVRWHGAPITLRSILEIGALTIPVNTCFALVVGILLVEQPWATVLLAGVAAFLLLSYRSYTALSQRFESLSMLYDFTRLVSGAQRPDSVLEAILTQAKDLLRADRAEIWLADDTDSYLRRRVDDDGRSTSSLESEYGQAMHKWLSSVDGASIVSSASPQHYGREIAHALHARDGIVAPITESGVVVGLVAVVNRLGEITQFQETDRTMFSTLASHASVALENGRLIDRLHHEAHERRHEALHDALTGLPNRVLFGTRLREELKAMAGSDTRRAVAVMDLDGFKEINDTLGHQSGDIVLGEVARRISHSVGPSALVARLGGDEFAILFPSIGTRAELEAVARRVRDDVNMPILTHGMHINVSVSIGFAVAPDDASDAATLLQRADVAMYSAKAGNGNGVAFYEAHRDENSPRRFTLGNDLRAAIADGQLSLLFQPKVRITDGTMVGVEALARWRHPVLGQVPPDEFIPLAERTGVINSLTVYVLRAALAEARRWRDAGYDWTVSVNVAMRNLLDHDFVTTVGELLASSGVNPAWLTLEITETGVMSDATRTIDVLARLAQLGLNLSIDDFGTGYSSLSYLQTLPVNEVKIDKLFVLEMTVDPGAEAIVRSVLDLARNLGLSVVAEGVEDRATWERLRSLGCTMAQGYYLSHPIPAEDLQRWHSQLHTLKLNDRREKLSPSPSPSPFAAAAI
jgi:diguanylate cyclase (GGDEF)-like protein